MFSPSEKRNVSLISLLYAFRMLGLFIILPVFMLAGQHLEHATPALLGLALGIYGLSQALLQVPFGLLSDRFGRKPLILAGLVMFAVGGLIAGLSDSIYGVILGRLLQGSGAIASVLMAFLSDLTKEENRTKAMASVGMTIGLAFAISIILGPLLSSKFGLSGLFFSTSMLAVVGMLVLLKLPASHVGIRRRDNSLSLHEVKTLLRNRELTRLDFGIFSLHLMLTATFVVVPQLLLHKFGLAVAYHGRIYFGLMALSFIGMIPLIIVGEKKQKVREIFISAVALITLSIGLLLVVDAGLYGFIACLFLFFLAFNYLEATLPSLVSRIAPAGNRGTAMGLYSSCQFFGAFMGGALGGNLYGMYEITGVYSMCLAIALLWLVVGMGMLPPPNTKSMILPLKPFAAADCNRIAGELQAVNGVEDVTLVVEEQVAYLKVDKTVFDDQVLMQHPLASKA